MSFTVLASCFRIFILKKPRYSRDLLRSCVLPFLFFSFSSIFLASGTLASEQSRGNSDIWPTLDIAVKKDKKVEAQVRDLLAMMTLEQKVAQMIQPEIRDITVEEMRQYGFGSYLNGGGAFPGNNKHASVADWIQLADAMYQASIDDSLDGSTIPTMWGTDAVHGHNNVIGATLFPHNIGLGAARNPQLIEDIAGITATEVMVTGIDWVFAPTVATVRDDRWGRTYESYSEDPEILKDYAAAIVKGLQGHAKKDFLNDQHVISTVKHFVGDGGTEKGVDQGDNLASEQALFDIHAQGYVGGLSAGAQSVMASFNSWHGEKLHGHRYLLTDVLKEKMGFDGFVVGDWNGHGQVENCNAGSCPQAANAGLDIYMAPGDWKTLYHNTLEQARSGEIPLARIDDAVTRILRVKVRAGLFTKPSPAKRPFSGKVELIGAAAHREVARRAVRESLVLLKNKNVYGDKPLLPLNPKLNILVAGDAADNIGKQSGGWTITWQGTGNTNEDFPGGTSIYAGIREQVLAAGGTVTLAVDGSFEKKPDVAIVVFGEEPYAEGQGDRDTLEYQPGAKSDLALLKTLKQAGIPVVSIFISGRPMWVNPELNVSDAFVAAWLPGSEGQGIADVILAKKNGKKNYDFKGKLSFSWPKTPNQIVNRFDKHYEPLLPYGFGLRYGNENKLADTLPEEKSIQQNEGDTQAFLNAGALNKAFDLKLFSGNEQLVVNSNTHQLGALRYRTTDRLVQEDTRRITIASNGYAGFRIESKSGTPVVVPIEKQKGKMTLELKLHSMPTGSVVVSLGCNQGGSNSCRNAKDISGQLNNLAVGEWSTLELVFDKEDPITPELSAQLKSPEFEIFSTGELDIEIYSIRYQASSSD